MRFRPNRAIRSHSQGHRPWYSYPKIIPKAQRADNSISKTSPESSNGRADWGFEFLCGTFPGAMPQAIGMAGPLARKHMTQCASKAPKSPSACDPKLPSETMRRNIRHWPFPDTVYCYSEQNLLEILYDFSQVSKTPEFGYHGSIDP